MPKPQASSRSEFVLASPQPGHRDKNNVPVRCTHCMNAYRELGITPRKVKPIVGRAKNLNQHLETCEHAIKALGDAPTTNATVLPGDESAIPVAQIREWLVNFIAENNLAMSVVDSSSLRVLLVGVCPGIGDKIPGRKVIGGSALDEQASQAHEQLKRSLKKAQDESGGRVNVKSGGWENIAKTSLLGCELSLMGHAITFALEETGPDHSGVAVARHLDDLLRRAHQEGWKLGAVVTDNAGQCAKARRILQYRWPHLAFIHCVAHDINNLVRQVLNLCYSNVMESPAKAANTLNGSASKWLNKAKEKMQAKYGMTRKIYQPAATRWNSMQACFASLLRVWRALTSLAHDAQEQPDFPQSLKVFLDPRFWTGLDKVEQTISPLAEASLKLQRDDNTLADVVNSFREIYLAFMKHSSLARELVRCVEGRWSDYEQPLFILAYCLHPRYWEDARKMNVTELTLPSAIADIADYLYRRLVLAAKVAEATDIAAAEAAAADVERGCGRLRSELKDWQLYGVANMRSLLAKYEGKPIKFWEYLRGKGMFQDLSKLAIRVPSIEVNTATCERLFSILGAIHTKYRNALEAATAGKLVAVKKRLREENGADEKTKKRQRIISPSELPLLYELGADTVHAVQATELDLEEAPEETQEDLGFESVAFWQSTLNIIFQDPEIVTGFAGGDANADAVPTSTNTGVVREDQLSSEYFDRHGVKRSSKNPSFMDSDERIVRYSAAFPMAAGDDMEQESHLTGIRSFKMSLAALFEPGQTSWVKWEEDRR